MLLTMARPREFDEDEVLQAALRLFWGKGYQGTSLDDLMAAMRLTKSSLYKAFGSKEALFWHVVERYQRDILVLVQHAFINSATRDSTVGRRSIPCPADDDLIRGFALR